MTDPLDEFKPESEPWTVDTLLEKMDRVLQLGDELTPTEANRENVELFMGALSEAEQWGNIFRESMRDFLDKQKRVARRVPTVEI